MADDKSKTLPAAGLFKAKESARFDHDRELVAARFSPCGKFLFAGSYDGRVYRWDLAAGTKAALSGHHGWIQGLAFHPDGRRMFTGDSWGGICCWDYADDAPAPKWSRTEGHARWMRSLALSPDGSLLATCGADLVMRVWSSEDGAPVWESPPQADDLLCAAFHPAGRSLLVGDLKGHVTDWDVGQHKPRRTLDASALFLRPLVSGVREINDVGGVRAMAFDAGGAVVACAGSQPATSGFFTGKPTIVLLDWETGDRKQLLQWENADPAEGITMDVAWHPAGGYFMAASSGQPGKGAFYCWRPGDKAPAHLDKNLAHSRSVSLHPDGKRVAVVQVLIKPGQQGGNGRRVDKNGEYVGLVSQIRVFNGVG